MLPNEGSRKHLRAKIQIGNAKGQISYTPNQTVFHHDDIKLEKRERKKEVNSWAKPSVLSNNREWNHSTVPNLHPVCERRTRENFINDRSNHYQYNYRAEKLPDKFAPPLQNATKFNVSLKSELLRSQTADVDMNLSNRTTKRTMEMPIHPNLPETFARGWNISTEISRKERLATHTRVTDNAKQNSRKVISNFVPTKDKHATPLQRTVKVQEEIRKQKMEGTFSLEKPVFAAPEKPVDRTALVNRNAIEKSLKYKTYKHSGNWEFNKTEGKHMWSDTGSFVYESRGDLVKTHNPDAYIYARPTLAK